MKLTKRMLGLAALAPAVWMIGSKLRSEQVANAPALATVVKLTYKPLFKWAAYRIVLGRYLDGQEPNKGRFTRQEVDRILERTWRNYDELAPDAHIERLKTMGNRQNVLLGVATLAMYRALLAEGIEKAYATELLTDVAWKIYEKWIVLPRFIARLVSHDPQEQVDVMLRMFLTYPFSRPGYDWKVRPEPDTFAVDILRCPVRDYLKSQGEEEFMLNSWCTLDFALAQVMTKGGHYERPHTLSAGDEVCDMKWYGRPQAADGRSGREEVSRDQSAEPEIPPA